MWGMSFNHSHIIQSGFIALPSNNVLLLSSSYVSHGLCQHLSIWNNFLAYFHHLSAKSDELLVYLPVKNGSGIPHPPLLLLLLFP